MAVLLRGITYCMLVLAIVMLGKPVDAATNQWSAIGPFGGNVRVVAVDPSNSNVVYAGTYAGGVFKSNNAGNTWSAINNGIANLHYYDMNIQTIAINPTNPQIVYAGTGYYGVLRSSDGGQSWAPSNQGIFGRPVYSIAFSPTNSSIMYLGSSDGVFRSTDSGASWTRLGTGIYDIEASGVSKVLVDRNNPSTLFATINGTGLFKSSDAGATWTLANNGLSNGWAQTIEQSGNTLFVGAYDGIYKSIDGGNSWFAASSGLTYINTIAANPVNQNELYVATYKGIFKTIDGGTSWQQMTNGVTNNWGVGITVDSRNPATVYIGAHYEGGIFKSIDSGASWFQTNDGLTATFFQTIAVDPFDNEKVYAGSDGGYGVARKSRTTGWQKSVSGFDELSRINVLTVDQVNSSNVYAGTYSGIYRSTDSGNNWSPLTVINNGISSSYIHGLALIPNTQTIYTGTEKGIYRSDDNGTTWMPETVGLPENVNGGLMLVDNSGAVYAIAAGGPYPEDNGYTDGGVYKKAVNGTWSKIGATFFPRHMAMDPSGSVIYAAVYGYGVYKSVNGGNWTQVSNGLTNQQIMAVAVDPTNPNKAYATAYGAVYQTVNGGANWTQLNTGLTHFNFVTIAIDATGSKLYLGTYYGGVFSYTFGTTATLTPVTRDFGASLIDSVVTESFTIANNGTSNLTVDAVTVESIGSNAFMVAGNNCGAYLVPSSSCVLTVDFRPSQAGNYASTLQLSYNASNNNSLFASLTGTAYEALAIATLNLPDGYAGVNYSTNLQANGGLPPYNWGASSLPVGLNLSSDGVISGTPAAATPPQDIQFTVSDSASVKNSATKTLPLTIYALPTITTSKLPNGTKGTAYNATLTATGGKQPYSWRVSNGSLPSGLSLNSATGAITGIPTIAGSPSVTFEVKDTNGIIGTKVLNVPISVVTQLSPWTNIYSSSPNNTSASKLPIGNFAVDSGVNRLLLVAVVMEIGSAANPTITASYGGTNLTQIKITNSTQREVVWIGYLKEAQIGSGSKALTVSYSGASGKVSALHVKWAAFSGVNQTNPLVSSTARNTNTNSATFGTSVSYEINGITTVVSGTGYTPSTATLNAVPAFMAGTTVSSNAQTSNTFITANHTASGSYASNTAVSWSGSSSTWSGLVAVSLRP